MASLTFYGGVGEIGGNKILLEEGKTRVFLDFGMSFPQAGRYFDEFMQPRKCNGVLDLIEFKLLPDLRGLYRCDYIKHCRRKKEERGYDGVILSHAHMDHAAYIHYLREDIPVHCTEGTKNILQALDETGSTGTSELIWLKESFKTYKNRKGELSRLQGEETKKDRIYNTTDDGRFSVGDLEIETLQVSHSLEGASACIIHTSSGSIVYTGDFRFHGYKGKLTEKFIKQASKAEPVALITEGTRVDSGRADSEEEVKEKAMAEVEKTKNLVVVNFPARDTDRMRSFHEVAKNTSRALVINLKQAYLLKLFEQAGIKTPRIDDEHIRVYIPRKTWGVLGDDRFPKNIQYQDYVKWEREFLEHPNAVTAGDIRKEQASFIFRCDFFELKELIDIRPGKKSTYIRSICEPFDIEMELNDEKITNWLKHFGLYPYKQMHASGHLNGAELSEVIEEIRPARLYPIHTEHPEIFRRMCENTIQIKENTRYNI